MTDIVAVALIAAIPPTLAAGVNIYINRQNRLATKIENETINNSVKNYHEEVNHKMDKLLEVTKKDAHAEGKLEGAAESKAENK